MIGICVQDRTGEGEGEGGGGGGAVKRAAKPQPSLLLIVRLVKKT